MRQLAASHVLAPAACSVAGDPLAGHRAVAGFVGHSPLADSGTRVLPMVVLPLSAALTIASLGHCRVPHLKQVQAYIEL